MNIDQKIDKILNDWEGTRMIEKHLYEPENLISELRQLIKNEFGVHQPSVPRQRTFKEIVRGRILVGNNIDDYELELYELNPENWPVDDNDEPIDLENHEVLELTEDKMVLAAGGDWQDAVKMTIELVDGHLIITKVERDFEWQDGLTDEQIIDILTK